MQIRNYDETIDEIDVEESKLRQITKVEELKSYVGKDVFVWGETHEMWEKARIIWTGDSKSRYFDERISIKFAERLLEHPITDVSDALKAELRAVSPLMEDILAIEENQGQKVLVIRNDRNLFTSKNGVPVGDHYCLLLDGSNSGIVLDERVLKEYRVSVEK